eukprot:3436994-Rhodomonas_salina.5
MHADCPPHGKPRRRAAPPPPKKKKERKEEEEAERLIDGNSDINGICEDLALTDFWSATAARSGS